LTCGSPYGSAVLLRCGKLLDHTVEVRDSLAEGFERDALVVSVHPPLVFLGQREWEQAVRLHPAQAELRRVGCAGGEERQDDGAVKNRGDDALKCAVEVCCNRGRRHWRAERGLQLNAALLVVDKFLE